MKKTIITAAALVMTLAPLAAFADTLYYSCYPGYSCSSYPSNYGYNYNYNNYNNGYSYPYGYSNSYPTYAYNATNYGYYNYNYSNYNTYNSCAWYGYSCSTYNYNYQSQQYPYNYTYSNYNTYNNGYNYYPNTTPSSVGQTSVFMRVGESRTLTISGNNSFVSNNTNPGVVNAALSGGTLFLVAQNFGSATINVCQAGGSCTSIFVTVQ